MNNLCSKCGADLSKEGSVFRRYSQYMEYGHYNDSGKFVSDNKRIYEDICVKCVSFVNSKESFIGIEMVFVKGGTLQMGDTFGDGGSDEQPIHEVHLDDFYIGKYPVTQRKWQEVMGNNPSRFKGDDNPVEFVSWNDVQDFIDKLNHQTGKKYRLPTEAEWEYAARSGGKNEKWAGTNNEAELSEYAWYCENSEDKTHPVGQKKPNELGIYDMSGNVWELCNDWYDEGYYSMTPRDNPQGPSGGRVKVLRGGSWDSEPGNLRSANRNRGVPTIRYDTYGFRLASPAR